MVARAGCQEESDAGAVTREVGPAVHGEAAVSMKGMANVLQPVWVLIIQSNEGGCGRVC